MPIDQIIGDLQQNGATDLSFVRELRSGLLEILAGMEDTCHRRDDSLHELEDELRADGYISEADLQAENEALRVENAALVATVELLESQNETLHASLPSNHQSDPQAALSIERRNSLMRIISKLQKAHRLIKRRNDEMIEEFLANDPMAINLKDAEQKSFEMKDSIDKLWDKMSTTGDYSAQRDLEDVFGQWDKIHRCLVTEQDRASQKSYDPFVDIMKGTDSLSAGLSSLRGLLEELRY
ncbi:hypothetical protein E8E13_003790 [Curvularia kusanoi]|uniref:Uncharacterized protein n=1 Tax=Curvularia kusanoi TaxID=90978 RepID=A0A9P4T8I2_CURKU|nr:hypothetical protein E8E13_003790 [Curvularia kusanoi]